MYRKVLIADDNESEITPLKKLLEEDGVEVVFAKNPREVFINIEKKDIDMLILDWYFLQPSNKYSIEVVEFLLDMKYFIPIFIYSNNIEDNEPMRELPNYPSILLNSMAKPKKENVDDVKSKIDKWFKSNPSVRLANRWYKSVEVALGTTLTEMYKKTDNGLINLLSQTYKSEQTEGSEDVINLIMTILSDNVLKESDIKTELDDILKEPNYNKKESGNNNYQQLRAYEMYSNTDKNSPISTGDIFKLDSDIIMKNEILKKYSKSNLSDIYAISISAECDYARSSEKLRFHKFIVGTSLSLYSEEFCDKVGDKFEEKLKSNISNLFKNNNEGEHLLPFILVYHTNNGDFENIVLDFQNVISFEKITFDNSFKEKRICRVRPVYMQHLLRRYSSFSSRIGIPEIPRKNSNDICEGILGNIKAKRISEGKNELVK